MNVFWQDYDVAAVVDGPFITRPIGEVAPLNLFYDVMKLIKWRKRGEEILEGAEAIRFDVESIRAG